jgi:hypothetical protein
MSIIWITTETKPDWRRGELCLRSVTLAGSKRWQKNTLLHFAARDHRPLQFRLRIEFATISSGNEWRQVQVHRPISEAKNGVKRLVV